MKGGRLYVFSRCVGMLGSGEPEKVFLECFDHWNNKSPGQRAIRFGLLPCVIDLLERSKDTPLKNQEGTYELEGKTQDRRYFKVIINKVNNEYHAWTWHRMDPQPERKKKKRQKEQEKIEKVHALLAANL